MPLFKNNRGFTLIESIVILSIMAMLALIIFINFRAYNKRNQLREAAQQIRSAIVEAQNMALAPKDSGNDWYYGLKFDRKSTTYQLCKYQPDKGETLIKTYTLPNYAEFPASQPSWGGVSHNLYLFFKPPNAEAYKLEPHNPPPPLYDIPAQSDTKKYTITLRLTDKSYSIDIVIRCATGQTDIEIP